MDTESQKLFDTLVRMQPDQLRETDIAFLNSRESYLSASEREAFAEILGEAKPEPKAKKAEK
jgi:hypothetical protein